MTTKEDLHREIERLAFEATKPSPSSTAHHYKNNDDHRRPAASLKPVSSPAAGAVNSTTITQLQSRLNHLERRLDQQEAAFIELQRATTRLYREFMLKG